MSKTIKNTLHGSNGHGRSLCGNGFRPAIADVSQTASCLQRHMQPNQAM